MTDHRSRSGAIAQLGERLLCKQEVTGSIPVGSTSRVLRLETGTGLPDALLGAGTLFDIVNG